MRLWCSVCRTSQDALEAYFNYIRSCAGSNIHPTIREVLTRASGRTTATMLSESANNGMRGRKRRTYDEQMVCLGLCGRPGGHAQGKAKRSCV